MAIRKPVEWTVDEARRHFRALVGEARDEGPRSIERPQSGDAIIVPLPAWEERIAVTGADLVEFFQRSGLGDTVLNLDWQQVPTDIAEDERRDLELVNDLERLADVLIQQREQSN